MILQPCIECGHLSARNRCDTHALPDRKIQAQRRGYDAQWRRLSRKARKLQPFCTDCGATNDLQADHSPEAWERHERGLPIRLTDVSVVCGECNRRRGQARPGEEGRPGATGHPSDKASSPSHTPRGYGGEVARGA